jgi:hypothetical protein
MTALHCSECGATYTEPDDSCQARFHQLLALDFSRREPWGSRHALAFAAFALQHPGRFAPSIVSRARVLIERVCIEQEPLDAVVEDLRSQTKDDDLGRPPMAGQAAPGALEVTVADLGAFSAPTYPEALLRWARAALSTPGEGVPQLRQCLVAGAQGEAEADPPPAEGVSGDAPGA